MVASDIERDADMLGGRVSFYDVTPAMVEDALAVARLVVVVVASVWAKFLYIDIYLASPQGLWAYLTVGIIAALLTQLVVSVSKSGARAGSPRRLPARIARALAVLTMAFLLLIAVGYLLKIAEDYSRGWMITWYVSSLAGVAGVEAIGATVRRRLARRGLFTRRVAVYGSGTAAHKLIARLRNGNGAIAVAGQFDDAAPAGADTPPPSGGLAALIEACRRNRVDDVVLVGTGAAPKGLERLLDELGQLPVNIHLAPDFVSFELANPRFARLGDANLVELQSKPLVGWSPWTKAVVDYGLGALFLIALSPLLAVIAAAVRLDSPGPVFFRQRRHGFNNQEIDVIKFRTMRAADCDDGLPVRQATRDDARVTRVGRFLRRTSLDELPQLINVLRGEMSLTGPRPHAVEHNLEYGRRIERYASRHRIKPGITGWAQVNGYRGETDVPEKMRKRIEYDIYYIENWSLAFDLRIIFLETLPALLRRQNAY